jgi:mono/diheme cytochrome c family protein
MTEYQQEQFPIPTPGRLQRELRLRRPPWWMVVGLILVIIATWIPLYLIYQKRGSFSTLPKIHYVQDMDNQPSFGPQQPSTLFADGRATRTPVAGTVARGHLRLDDHYYRGYRTTGEGAVQTIEFLAFPETVSVDAKLSERGRERYAIYCTVCHDETGSGNGIVHQRAVALKETKWVPPTNLLNQEIRDRADGQIFQAIGDGVRNMPSYNTQVNVADRWAIVAYVRELQMTQPVAVVEK